MYIYIIYIVYNVNCLFAIVSRLSSRRASDQWSRGYFRRRSSPSNLPVYPESVGPGKESSPPVSHSSVESNSSGVGNDSSPTSTPVNPFPKIINATLTRKVSIILTYNAKRSECKPLMVC